MTNSQPRIFEAASHQDAARQIATLSAALLDATRWLETAGSVCQLRSVVDAGERARAALAQCSAIS